MKPDHKEPGLPTRAEVLRMPAGHALDVLVAEHVMGWRPERESYGDTLCRTPDGDLVGVHADDDSVPSGGSWFNPSRDIAAAWLVLGAHHWPWRIAQDPAGWSEVVIQRWAGGEEDGDWEEVRVTCENNEVPRGICRAALLARTGPANVHGTIEHGT